MQTAELNALEERRYRSTVDHGYFDLLQTAALAAFAGFAPGAGLGIATMVELGMGLLRLARFSQAHRPTGEA